MLQIAKARSPSPADTHTRFVNFPPVANAAPITNSGVATIITTRSGTDGVALSVARNVMQGAYNARVSPGIHFVSRSKTACSGAGFVLGCWTGWGALKVDVGAPPAAGVT